MDLNRFISALAVFFIQGVSYAAYGDKAPSIPDTYVTTHPRLGAPTTTFLDALYATGAGGVYGTVYKAAADAWTNTGTIWNCRYTLTAYLADKQAGGPDHAGWLTKVQAMDAASNFACRALAYDWAHDDLTASDKSRYLVSLASCSTLSPGGYETNWNSNTSPYNDGAYISGITAGMWCAIAQYPDAGDFGKERLEHAVDVLINVMMPVWRQQFSRNGVGTTGASDTDNGGMFTEGWSDYVNASGGNGLNAWIVPWTLAWANASGRGLAFFTEDHPWLRNYAYWTAYLMRPDFQATRIGQVALGNVNMEYSVSRSGGLPAKFGSLEGLAEIYDDPDLRAWIRRMNWGTNTPDGFEPSAYPWLDPDDAGESVVTPIRSGMSLTRHFPGSGTIFMRSGWGEDDLQCTFRYGNGFWSHPTQDAGAYTCYRTGALAIKAGSYRPGAFSLHQGQYTAAAISHNTMLFYDTADEYADEEYIMTPPVGSTWTLTNDGGQRRTGSNYGNQTGAATANALQAPADVAMWNRAREYYDYGTLLGYAVGGSTYVYAAADITKAYNNSFSRNPHTGPWQPLEANSINRSHRVQKFVRHMIFIPRTDDGYFITYDQAIATAPTISKVNLIHTINQPSTGTYSGGDLYTATRADRVRPTNFMCGNWYQWNGLLARDTGDCGAGGFFYQYAGKMYGFAPDMGSSTTITQTVVGGPGSEFLVGTTNYNQCAPGQCDANFFGDNPAGYITANSTWGTVEAGAWRIEQAPDAANKEDWFLNVQLYTSTSATNIVVSSPAVTESGASCIEGANCNWVATWTDSGGNCTYTLTLPKYGTGGNIEIAGAGCTRTVNESLYATVVGTGTNPNPGTWTQLTTLDGYYNPLNPHIPGYDQTPGYVPALDMATIHANYRSTSGETQQTLFGYSFVENRLNVIDDGGLFSGPHFNTAAHPQGSNAIDPAYNLWMGWSGVSGQRAPMIRQQTYWYDFNALAGREKHTYTPASGGAASIPAASFDVDDRLLVIQGGTSFAGYGVYSSSVAAYTKNVLCTADTDECPSPQSQSATMAYREADGKLWMMSNQGVHTYDYRNSTAAIVNITDCTPSCPNPRNGAGFMYMPEEDKFLLAGGWDTVASVSSTDTWVLDPTIPSWTRITSSGVPSGGAAQGLFSRFTYIPRHQIALAWATDNLTQTTRPLYAFRYRPGAPAGWQRTTYAASTGTYNRNSDSWANAPALTADATNVYLIHVETGGKATTSVAKHFSPYAHKVTTSATTNLGADYSAFGLIDPANGDENNTPDIALIDNQPWACWSPVDYPTDPHTRIAISSWTGSEWSTPPARMSSAGSGGGLLYMAQAWCDLVGISTTPYFAFAEATNGSETNLFVYKWDGSTFAAVGSYLNHEGADNSFVDSVALVSNSTQPVVAWTEYVQNTSTTNVPQVWAKQYNGSSWEAMCGGTSANVTNTRRAQHVSATWLNGSLYVAFVERATEGANGGVSKLYVRSCSGPGGSWSTVSGPINKDSANGWAYKPIITSTGSTLYVAWTESGNTAQWLTNVAWNLGLSNKPQLFVASMTVTGSSTTLGGSLNMDTVDGSAQYPAITIMDTTPIAAWREHKLGSLAQIYVKKWDGSTWTAISTAAADAAESAVSILNILNGPSMLSGQSIFQ